MDESGGSGQPRSGRTSDRARVRRHLRTPATGADGDALPERPRPPTPQQASRTARDPGRSPADGPRRTAPRALGPDAADSRTAHGAGAPAEARARRSSPARRGTGAAPAPAAPAPPVDRDAQGPGGGILMGRPFGVPVYVAPSWFLVAALITWVFGGQLDRVLPELGAARYLVALFFAVAFYASVLVHELAHTVAALRFKLPVRRIQLQFFGGVSEIEKESETPGREFVLAFVGPLLSLVLAGVFYARHAGRRARHRPRRAARRPDDLQPHRRRLQPAARPAPGRRPDAARRRLEDHRQAR